MAIKFGADGTIYCNTVKYNYKQARNMIADGSYGNISGCWVMSGVSAVSSPAGYKSYRCFQFNAGGTSMLTQNMPTPIAGHKYYGGLMWKTTGNTFSADDNRFEWYCKDSSDGTMVFAYKDVATNGNWVKLSSVQTLKSVASGNWTIRNFLVNSSTVSYCSRMIIIDLTDTFGAGNEPSKEWCDNNIREWEVYVNYGNVSKNLSTSNYKTKYVSQDLSYRHDYNYLSLDEPYYPREYMIHIYTNDGSPEGFLISADALTLNNTYTYYFQVETFHYYDTFSYDCYFPISEPNLGNVRSVLGQYFNGGGGMYQWKRTSMYGNRTTFSNGSYQLRFDLNNPVENGKYVKQQTRITAIQLVTVHSQINQYNAYNNTNISINDVNKEWCDRWVDGRSSPIIHIKDHLNNTIKFNTDYDIVCNDIEIRPELSKIIMDNTGTIKCKKLVRVQAY